jgi:hypothetical protein
MFKAVFRKGIYLTNKVMSHQNMHRWLWEGSIALDPLVHSNMPLEGVEMINHTHF